MFLTKQTSITYFVMMLWLCPIQVMGDNITQVVNNGQAVVNKNGTVILGVTQYDYDAARKQLDGLKEVLDQLLDIIGKKNIPVEKVASTLLEMAKRYKELRTQVQSYTSDDPEIQVLLNTAQKELEQGHFEETERLYNQVAKQIEEKIQNVRELKDKRLLSAAEAKYANGSIKVILLEYSQALDYYQQAVKLLPTKYEEQLGRYLNDTSSVFYTLGQYNETKPLLERSLYIREKVLGKKHPDTARVINSLAALYQAQGNYREAELLCERSLTILEDVLGKEHSDVAQVLNNLAIIYQTQLDYDKAELLHKRSLAILEKALGKEHPEVAKILNNLANTYQTQFNYGKAEPLYKRSLAISEKTLGKEHPLVAHILGNLATLYDARGSHSEAKSLYERSLSIFEKVLGKEHLLVAHILHNLAALHQDQSDYSEAKPLYERSLVILKKVLGEEHPITLTNKENLTGLMLKVILENRLKVRVAKIVPNSPAGKMGIQTGDIFVQYDNHPVINKDLFVFGRNQEPKEGTPRPLQVLRRDKELTFMISPGKIGVVLEDYIIEKQP